MQHAFEVIKDGQVPSSEGNDVKVKADIYLPSPNGQLKEELRFNRELFGWKLNSGWGYTEKNGYHKQFEEYPSWN